MLPQTGSTITAAMGEPACGRNAAASPSRSFHATVTVSAAVPGVTPAEPGSPSVAAPEPAFTSRQSAWPW